MPEDFKDLQGMMRDKVTIDFAHYLKLIKMAGIDLVEDPVAAKAAAPGLGNLLGSKEVEVEPDDGQDVGSEGY